MTIHFAAARSHEISSLARILARPERRLASNDNGAAFADNTVLRAALKHFAAHGLAAAGQAQANADRAFVTGDAQAYRHWLAICTALDRRMAMRISARHARANPRQG